MDGDEMKIVVTIGGSVIVNDNDHKNSKIMRSSERYGGRE